jgi:hypothetical protein
MNNRQARRLTLPESPPRSLHDRRSIFDLRLYGDPYTIVPRVECMRQKMRTLGYEKPIVCAEYGGPSLFQFAANRQYRAWVTAWSQAVADPVPLGVEWWRGLCCGCPGEEGSSAGEWRRDPPWRSRGRQSTWKAERPEAEYPKAECPMCSKKSAEGALRCRKLRQGLPRAEFRAQFQRLLLTTSQTLAIVKRFPEARPAHALKFARVRRAPDGIPQNAG